MDDMTKEQRHKNMSHIRAKDIKPEVLLRKALWRRGIRYRKNYADLPVKQDIALTCYRIAVFVDGDFLHARGHQECPGEQVESNKEYWQKKLRNNIERDKAVNDALTEEGWLVLRFWASDVMKHLDDCVNQILQYIPDKK